MSTHLHWSLLVLSVQSAHLSLLVLRLVGRIVCRSSSLSVRKPFFLFVCVLLLVQFSLLPMLTFLCCRKRFIMHFSCCPWHCLRHVLQLECLWPSLCVCIICMHGFCYCSRCFYSLFWLRSYNMNVIWVLSISYSSKYWFFLPTVLRLLYLDVLHSSCVCATVQPILYVAFLVINPATHVFFEVALILLPPIQKSLPRVCIVLS